MIVVAHHWSEVWIPSPPPPTHLSVFVASYVVVAASSPLRRADFAPRCRRVSLPCVSLLATPASRRCHRLAAGAEVERSNGTRCERAARPRRSVGASELRVESSHSSACKHGEPRMSQEKQAAERGRIALSARCFAQAPRRNEVYGARCADQLALTPYE